MDFWKNLLRYPRFFISSMIGLIFILANPIIQLAKELKNKQLFFLLFFLCISLLLFILNLMLNPPI